MKKILTAAIALSVASVAHLRAVDESAVLANMPELADDPKAETPVPKFKTSERPRLLFDKEFIAKLKKNAETDPVLKNAVASVTSWASRPGLIKPQEKPDVTKGDTEALSGGFGSYPGLAFAYAIDPNPATLENIRQLLENMLNAENWTTKTAEVDSNMGAANCMAFAAFLFDAAYNDLEPEFRKKMAEKIFDHARRMYWIGYKGKGPHFAGKGYWTSDPMNNHRWHRGCGQAASLLAVADDIGEPADFFLAEAKKELEFILKYYSNGGDYAEGTGYQTFGFMYLMLTAWMFDRCTDSDYLTATPGFREAWRQQVHYGLPSGTAMFGFGDDNNTGLVMGNLNGAFLVGPLLSRDKDAFASYMKFYNDRRLNPAYMDRPPPAYPWSFLLFYDATLDGGDALKEPLNYYIEDLGAVSFFDKWEKDAVVFTFKCGPYGGYALNVYRHDMEGRPEGATPRYLNLAHNDPDAASVALAKDGHFFLHPGNYSTNKITANISSVLVDGTGQKCEGGMFLQPHRTADMREFSYLTGWKADGNRAIVEGEAGNAYPGLEAFRRSCVWLPGEYILVLDNIVAKAAARLDWHGIGRFFVADAAADKCYATPSGPGDIAGRADDRKLPFQVRSNKPTEAAIDFYSLNGRWNSFLLNILDIGVNDKAVRYATAFDAWDKNINLDYSEADGVVTLKVKGKNIDDTWTWTPTSDRTVPSSIVGTRGGKEIIALTAKDVAPREHWNPAPVAPPDDPKAAAAEAAKLAQAKEDEAAKAKRAAMLKPAQPAAPKTAKEKSIIGQIIDFFSKK